MSLKFALLDVGRRTFLLTLLLVRRLYSHVPSCRACLLATVSLVLVCLERWCARVLGRRSFGVHISPQSLVSNCRTLAWASVNLQVSPCLLADFSWVRGEALPQVKV